MHQIKIDVQNGSLTPGSYRDLKSAFQLVKQVNGGYLVTITEHRKRYTPTRYRYYFDCILGLSFPVARKFCGWNYGGMFQPVHNVENLHEWLKIKYNPRQWIDPATGEIRITGITTTSIPDKEFINEYQEVIIAYFCGEPFFMEGIPMFEEWKEMHTNNEWWKYKARFYQTK